MLAEELNSDLKIVKRINVSRAFIYFVVTGLQYYWMLEWLSNLTPSFYNVYLVIVPAFLTILDFALILWNPEQTQRFMKIARFVSILAIAISINTFLPIIGRSTYDSFSEIIMVILGFAVFMVSVIEITALIAKDRMKYRTLNYEEENVTDSGIRTYDR